MSDSVRDNGNVHQAAANIIVSKSRAARGSVCNVLLSRAFHVVCEKFGGSPYGFDPDWIMRYQ